MDRRTESAIFLVCTMSAAAGLVALAMMIVVGGFAISPAVFVAILVAIPVGLFLFIALQGKAGDPPVNLAEAPDSTAFTPSAMRAEAPDAGSGRSAADLAPAPDRATVAATLDTEAGTEAGRDTVRSGIVEADMVAGTKPVALSAPRDGGADDLKMIKGVGPKLEGVCNDLGFYHFDQIAAWTPAEVAWVDENLEGFKGRVSRDEWVDQASTLARGGETEFSKKAGDGGIY